MKRFVSHHIPALLYAALIITLSSIPRADLPEIALLRADKLLHFAEYAVFAVLIYRSMSDLFGVHRLALVFWVSSGITILFAAIDEFYQKYVPGRHSDAADLILDIAGAVLILFLLWYRQKKRKNQTEIKV